MIVNLKKYSAGFTLVELIIVVIIIGILAGVAIPGYQKTVEKGYADKAKVILQAIYTAEKLYRLDYGTYGDLDVQDSDDDLIGRDYIEDPNAGSPKFTYTITVDTEEDTFTAEAERIGDTSKYITIDQDGTITPTGY